jgi:hypothetical protein
MMLPMIIKFSASGRVRILQTGSIHFLRVGGCEPSLAAQTHELTFLDPIELEKPETGAERGDVRIPENLHFVGSS